MSIADFTEKIKLHSRVLYTILLLLVLASVFFALGRLSALEEKHEPIKITSGDSVDGYSQTALVGNAISAAASASNPILNSNTATGGEVIGVKTSKKYYFPWCGPIKQSKVQNQVHFASIETARAAGYVAGGNCKGLK
jgi:hypothetical protein